MAVHQDRLNSYTEEEDTHRNFQSTQGQRSALLNNSDTQWVRCNAEELSRIPAPDVEWKWCNVGLSNSMLKQLSHRGLIEKYSKEDRTWKTKTRTYKAILEYST